MRSDEAQMADSPPEVGEVMRRVWVEDKGTLSGKLLGVFGFLSGWWDSLAEFVGFNANFCFADIKHAILFWVSC